MEKIEKLSKSEKLKKYLAEKEKYEVRLLDMLRAWELQQQHYKKIIEENDKAYYRFLSELKNLPVSLKNLDWSSAGGCEIKGEE